MWKKAQRFISLLIFTMNKLQKEFEKYPAVACCLADFYKKTKNFCDFKVINYNSIKTTKREFKYQTEPILGIGIHTLDAVPDIINIYYTIKELDYYIKKEKRLPVFFIGGKNDMGSSYWLIK